VVIFGLFEHHEACKALARLRLNYSSYLPHGRSRKAGLGVISIAGPRSLNNNLAKKSRPYLKEQEIKKNPQKPNDVPIAWKYFVAAREPEVDINHTLSLNLV
jgi:hypothetical protein